MKDLEWEQTKKEAEDNWIQIKGESLHFEGDRRILLGLIGITTLIVVVAILSKLL